MKKDDIYIKARMNFFKTENQISITFSVIRLDQELMKSFEELTYNFQEFI